MKGNGPCNGGIRDFSLSVVLAFLAATTACAVDPGARTSAARPSSATTPAATTPSSASEHHGGGFAPDPQAPPVPSTVYSGSLPVSVDLSRFNAPVSDQGDEAKCAATSTGYYLRGWYAKRDGLYPASGFSGDFTYDQVPHQSDGDTTFADNLNIQETEGLDTGGDYKSDTANCSVSDASLTNAVRYKIAGYSDHRSIRPPSPLARSL